jgi:sugar/nucleoside kinase (ribokinase family)
VYYDVVLPGDYFFDLIYTDLPEFPSPGREVYSKGITATGGAMFITAVSLRRLGVRAGWVACFGNDYYSEYVHRLALEENLNLSLAACVDQPYRRVTTAIPFQGERAFVTYADPPPLDLQTHWLSAMQQCDFAHLHLGGIMSLERLTPLANEARSHGATISMDCQDVPNLRTACTWKHVLSMVDVFMPNAREARIVSGMDSLDGALRWLTQWTKVIVVKDGANGAWVASEGSVVHAPAISVGPVVDTTGAGDCFNAGFLFGYVVEKAPVPLCARYGNICGGLSVTQVGGATAAPTLEQLKKISTQSEGEAGNP